MEDIRPNVKFYWACVKTTWKMRLMNTRIFAHTFGYFIGGIAGQSDIVTVLIDNNGLFVNY